MFLCHLSNGTVEGGLGLGVGPNSFGCCCCCDRAHILFIDLTLRFVHVTQVSPTSNTSIFIIVILSFSRSLSLSHSVSLFVAPWCFHNFTGGHVNEPNIEININFYGAIWVWKCTKNNASCWMLRTRLAHLPAELGQSIKYWVGGWRARPNDGLIDIWCNFVWAHTHTHTGRTPLALGAEWNEKCLLLGEHAINK